MFLTWPATNLAISTPNADTTPHYVYAAANDCSKLYCCQFGAHNDLFTHNQTSTKHCTNLILFVPSHGAYMLECMDNTHACTTNTSLAVHVLTRTTIKYALVPARRTKFVGELYTNRTFSISYWDLKGGTEIEDLICNTPHHTHA